MTSMSEGPSTPAKVEEMARLSKLTEKSSAQDAVNALKHAQEGNGGQLNMTATKGGTYQSWSFKDPNGEVLASGSIPMNASDGSLRGALEKLIKAVEAHGIAD